MIETTLRQIDMGVQEADPVHISKQIKHPFFRSVFLPVPLHQRFGFFTAKAEDPFLHNAVSRQIRPDPCTLPHF